MSTLQLVGRGLTKRFGDRLVLNNIDVACSGGEVVGIIGPNGSGKSTLLEIMAGLLRPDAGTVSTTTPSTPLSGLRSPVSVGFVAPYLNIYDEFTPYELMKLQSRLRGEVVDTFAIDDTLSRVGLAERADDLVRTLSSGLRQRVILALAVVHEPLCLMLDEPSVTLDDVGRAIVADEVRRQRSRGGITMIATNDDRERQLCDRLSSVTGP